MSCSSGEPKTSPVLSSELEVRVEDVRPPPAHLGTLNVCGATVELGLIPLTLLELVIPLHALLCCKSWVCLVLVHVQAAKLFNLQILAGVLGRIGMNLLCVLVDSATDLVGSLGRLVPLRHVETVVIGSKFLPVGRVVWFVTTFEREMEVQVVFIRLVDHLVNDVKVIDE